MSQAKPKYKLVKAFAPATVANVGCGFDIMGFALMDIGDCVTVRLLPEGESNYIEMTGKYGHLIPTDWDRNTASVAIQCYLESIASIDIALHVTIEKNLPLGSGMGSSAASAVAGVVAINELMGKILKREELLRFAMEGERVACGAAHADNVAPSLFGGFVLVRSYNPLDVIPISFETTWWVAVAHPQMVLKTADSRKILNQEVSIHKAIQQSANCAALMLALISKSITVMRSAIHDELAEPQRTQLIPNFNTIRNNVLQAQAFNCNISGSGPSIFSICETEEVAKKVGFIMQQGFKDVGLQSEIHLSPFKANGAVIIDKE